MCRSSRSNAVAVLSLVVLALAGCGDDDTTPTPGGTGSAVQQLDGRAFVLVDLDDAADVPREIVPGSTIRLAFSGGRLDATAGCNSLGGEVAVNEGRLVVDSLSTTEMACDPPLMEQEAWLGSFLTDRPELDLTGPDLTLTTPEVTAHLEEEVTATAELAGTEWLLESVLDGRGPEGSAGSPPRRAAGATLLIDEGRLRFDTGCNTGSAAVEYDDERLEVGELVLGLRDCGPAMADLERRVDEVLTPPTAYELDGTTLTLWSADGTTGLGFRAG